MCVLGVHTWNISWNWFKKLYTKVLLWTASWRTTNPEDEGSDTGVRWRGYLITFSYFKINLLNIIQSLFGACSRVEDALNIALVKDAFRIERYLKSFRCIWRSNLKRRHFPHHLPPYIHRTIILITNLNWWCHRLSVFINSIFKMY